MKSQQLLKEEKYKYNIIEDENEDEMEIFVHNKN